MNQVKCPDCGETYCEDLQSCPNCGCPNDNSLTILSIVFSPFS